MRCVRARRAPLDTFLEFAVAHQLSIVVLGAIQESPLCDAFPPRGVEVLRRKCREQGARSRLLLRELERLADRFEAAGQRFLLLKGPYLAARFYGDAHRREFVDLDLLVPAGDRERAFRLLVEAGYARKSRALLGVRLTCYFVHGIDFVSGSSKIDLHWCLSRHPSFRIDERAIWSSRRSYDVGGRPYDVLSDEHEVVLAVLSMLRDFERGRPKIKNLVDLLRILEALDKRLDWDAFLEARRGEGTLGPTVNILGLCLDIAGAHDCFPGLHAALARHAGRRVPVRLAGSPFVFAPASFGLGNKLWCARVYDASVAAWLLWWGVSLPFRIAVHRRRHQRPGAGVLWW
ncbi:MAG: nucleotidyltransferase family protein [Candidatus Binatia bacterium]